MRTLTVLVTGAGGTYGLGTIANLRRASLPLRLVGADVVWNAPGLFQVDVAAVLPRCGTASYDQKLMELCRREHVDAVFITSGAEVQNIARRREEVESRIGALLVVNSQEIVDLAADKLETARSLARWGFASPRTADVKSAKEVAELISEVGFPLIAKPRFGQGSQGVVLILDKHELKASINKAEPYVIQEYIGDADHEYTVGVVGAEDGRVFGSIVLRRWLKSGQTAACEVVDEPVITAYAEAITTKMKPRGYLNVQLRLRKGAPCAFEINGRVSSSTGFRGLAGFNEPELILRTHLLKETPQRPALLKVRMVRSTTEYVVNDTRWSEFAPK